MPDSDFRDQLQELYRHLEHTTNGDQFIAYYGQLRAVEHPHHEALQLTIEHFRLESRDWYQRRMARLGPIGGVTDARDQ